MNVFHKICHLSLTRLIELYNTTCTIKDKKYMYKRFKYTNVYLEIYIRTCNMKFLVDCRSLLATLMLSWIQRNSLSISECIFVLPKTLFQNIHSQAMTTELKRCKEFLKNNGCSFFFLSISAKKGVNILTFKCVFHFSRTDKRLFVSLDVSRSYVNGFPIQIFFDYFSRALENVATQSVYT